MLAQTLAIIVALGSFLFYIAAFFFPEVHRKNDFIWSGIGLFYALVLWVCAGRITGGVLLGQTASVALLVWLGWQTLTLRRAKTPTSEQTPITPEVEDQVKGFPGQLVSKIKGIFQKKEQPQDAGEATLDSATPDTESETPAEEDQPTGNLDSEPQTQDSSTEEQTGEQVTDESSTEEQTGEQVTDESSPEEQTGELDSEPQTQDSSPEEQTGEQVTDESSPEEQTADFDSEPQTQDSSPEEQSTEGTGDSEPEPATQDPEVTAVAADHDPVIESTSDPIDPKTVTSDAETNSDPEEDPPKPVDSLNPNEEDIKKIPNPEIITGLEELDQWGNFDTEKDPFQPFFSNSPEDKDPEDKDNDPWEKSDNPSQDQDK